MLVRRIEVSSSFPMADKPLSRFTEVLLDECPASVRDEPELAFMRTVMFDGPKIGHALIEQWLLEDGRLAGNQESTEFFKRCADGNWEAITPTRAQRKALKVTWGRLKPLLSRPDLVPCPDCGWAAYVEGTQPVPGYCETCACHGAVAREKLLQLGRES